MAAARQAWAKLIGRHGISATLIRLAEPDNLEVQIRVMRRFAEESKLEHEVSQQDAWFVVEYTALQGTAIERPEKNDRIRIDDQHFTVFLVTPKIAHSEMVGYELRCTGG